MTRRNLLGLWAAVILLAGLAVWCKPSFDRAMEPVPVDTLAVIAELAGPELLSYWPSAPQTMQRMARVFDLDPLLLPCIARIENPHPKHRNPYGMTWRGRVVQYDSYTYATYRAAELLAKLRPIYQGERGPNIPALAKVWCPLNQELWARNMAAVYQEAVK